MIEKSIPFHRPSIGVAEEEEVLAVLRSGWLTTGPKTKQFEDEFREAVGAKFALAVSSGTAGLHLALEATGVGPGDKVITTPYTFTATAEVIRYLGADPVFVDIDPETLNIRPDLIVEAMESVDGVKAILPVHFAGKVCPMDQILATASNYGCAVIEDAAHAFPAKLNGKAVGSIGDMTVFSFYVTKPLATGEGGMITTDDAAFAERIKVMRLHGIDRDAYNRRINGNDSHWYYEVVAPGFKYNLTDLASAVGIHQLRKAEMMRDRRQVIAEKYNEAFRSLPVKLPSGMGGDDTHAWHLYVIRLQLDKLSIGRDEFITEMGRRGIGTSVHFIPLHLHPYWREKYQLVADDFPAAHSAYQGAVSLPIFPSMTDAEVSAVIDEVNSIISRNQIR